MSGYDHDIKLERVFAKRIKGILGCCFIGQDVKHDLTQATDFEIFTVKPFTVAARLRRYDAWLKYPQDFTIRWSRPSGVPTEIDKIRQGFGNYLFYGFVNEQENKIIQYLIGDLDTFRQVNQKPLCVLPNDPHDSDLAVFSVWQFPRDFLIHWWPPETAPVAKEQKMTQAAPA
jgi:hypothetical protein